MPKIVVEGPDGRKFAFPDTMPRAEINAFMKQKYGTKARDESVQDYLARFGREQAATEARVKDIDREATAVGRAEGERAAERMGVDNPFLMAFAAPAIGIAQQEGGRQVFNREGTVLADEAAGLNAINAAGFMLPGILNKDFGAQAAEGRRQQPLAAFAGDIAGGYGPGEIIGAGVAKAAQAIGPGMAAVGRMFSGQKLSPEMQSTLQQTAVGSIGGSAYGNFNDVNQDGVIDQKDVYAGAVAGGVGLPATVKGAQVAGDFMPAPRGAPRVAPDAMPAGGYFGRQSMRPPGSGPSPREIETRQQWATATPIVTQARTTALSAQQAADAALQSKAPADIARAKDQKKTLVGQIKEAQASRAGMDTPEDARLAETLASLTENTSDPVLLSTQISAAKTSLDRLLTDIGSPVEGNLIPVKTNILTRTQAPRSAAEGPQDRASVTRYAEGSDDVQPMGFGAGTPKTPEQAVRFETPGSPEWEAAKAKGLDMSQAGRMGRAKEMGYDTETVLYHGTTEDFDAFIASENGAYGPGIYFGTTPKIASSYASPNSYRQGEMPDNAKVIPVYLKKGQYASLSKIDDVAAEIRKNNSAIDEDASYVEAVKKLQEEGFIGVRDRQKGYISIFDPANIRSVNAAFDPEKAGSSTLLAAAPFAAVGGAGLTSERELGSKMTRDKKD